MAIYGYLRSDSEQVGVSLSSTESINYDKVYTDICSSRIKPLERPAFKELMSAIKPGDVVYTLRAYMLTRDARERKALLQHFKENSVSVIETDTGHDITKIIRL